MLATKILRLPGIGHVMAMTSSRLAEVGDRVHDEKRKKDKDKHDACPNLAQSLRKEDV